MAVVIASQPSLGSIVAAYNPIPYVVLANESSTSDPCKVVYIDVYFNSVYYGTFSSTVYFAIVGPYGEYHFDIQDKAQEFLNSQFLIDPSTTNNGKLIGHYTTCFVRVRDTDIDINGFIYSPYTEPVQGTYYEPPVSGGGVLSNTFYILNSSLKTTDSYNLITHLKKYTPAWYVGFDFGWMMSHRPNEVTSWGAKIGGGKYWICPKDHDMIAFWTELDLVVDVTGYVAAQIIHLDGSVETGSILFSAMPIPFTTGANNTFFLNGGIPNMSSLLPSLNWTNIRNYTVYVAAPFTDIATQTYYVSELGCCKERIRIFFLNTLGAFDAINFTLTEEVTQTESKPFQKSLPYIYQDRKERGLGRLQPQQVDVIECYTEDYTEQDNEWIKELFGTSKAYVQLDKDILQGVNSEIYPINIIDTDFIKKKSDDRFVYTVVVKFSYSNNVTNLRS